MLDLLDEKAVQYAPVSAYYLDTQDKDELDIESRTRGDIYYNLDPKIDIDVVCEELIHQSDISQITLEKIIEVSDENTQRIEDSIGRYIDFIKQTFADVENDFNEYPKFVFNASYNRLNLPDFINDETKFSKTLEQELDSTKRYEMVEKHCIDLIYELRKEWYSLADSAVKKAQIEKEIRKMVLNIRNFRYATNNRNMNDIYLRLLSIDTLTLSTITILDNNQQSADKTLEMIDDNITNKKMLYDLYRTINNPIITAKYEKRVDDIKNKWFTDIQDPIERDNKIDKAIKGAKSKMIPVAYSTWDGVRPHEDIADYEHWNGFQSFDLDIKEASEQDKVNGKKVYTKFYHDAKDVDRIKNILHNRLKKYNWYLCTKTSISGLGLHILTKVKPMHTLFKDSPKNTKLINKFWFMMNYYQKYSIIRWILLEESGIDPKYINKVVDAAMMKISQGIVLNTDTKALWNDNFIDLPQIYGFSIPPKEGLELEDWLKHKDNLKRILTKKNLQAVGHESLSAMRKKTHHTVDIKPKYDTITYQFSSVEIPNIDEITPIDEDNFQSGQRDMMRHKLIRTMIYLYGVSNDVKDLCRRLLKVPTVFSEQEFIGKWNYAHKKPFIFDDMLILLKASGCKFTIEKDVLEEVKDSKLHKAIESLKETDVVFNEVMPDYAFNLDGNKSYLGSVKDDLLESLETDRVNVIESPPGTGKTTLFNILASEYTVCLVCPYVSVLKNKVENDLTASKMYDVCYDNKPVTIERGRSVATTFDKFSKLTYDEYKNFDLIAVDESHLLFTSIYREAVTVSVANNISKFVTNEMALKERMTFDIGMTNTSGSFLENTSLYRTMAKSGTKVVLMTGTITGELIYFKRNNALNYLKINAKHKYGKHAEFVLCDSARNATITLVQTIAQALDEGKTVICPTNRGDAHVAAIVAQVRVMMKTKLTDKQWTYYRKSNSHHDICDSINSESILPDDARLLFCTVYLGVGVDILNERDYLVVFDGDNTTAQDIEQFNNRIRRSYINSSIIYSALVDNVAGIKEIKKSIYDTPSEIELKHVGDYTEEINDDRKIAQSNARLQQTDDYAKINLPEHLKLDEIYHDITHEGAVFNEDKFLIRGFSHDYNKIASGAAYTKYVLTNYYDYSVSYKVSVVDDPDLVKSLDEASKEAKKKVILDKADAFLQTVYFCAEHWEKLRNRNSLDFEPLKIDDFELRLEDTDKSKEGKEQYDYTIKYSIAYEEHFKLAYSRMRKLLKLYEAEDAIKFMESHVGESGKINYTELRREMRLINFVRLSRDKNMLLATSDIFNIIDDFINNDDEVVHISNRNMIIGEFGMRSLRISLNKYADKYFENMSSEDMLTSAKRREEMFDKTDETIKTLFKLRKNKDGDYNATIRQIPKFNSKEAETEFTFDAVVKTFLAADLEMEEKTVEVNILDYDNRKEDDYAKKVGGNEAVEDKFQGTHQGMDM